MRANPILWMTWPTWEPDYEGWLQYCLGNCKKPSTDLPERWEEETNSIRQLCVAGLKAAALISVKTGWRDVSIGDLVKQIRDEVEIAESERQALGGAVGV